MMSFVVMVNDDPISQVRIVRALSGPDGLHDYSVHFSNVEGEQWDGAFQHQERDGSLICIEKALAHINHLRGAKR